MSKSESPLTTGQLFISKIQRDFLKADIFTLAGIAVFCYFTYINVFVLSVELYVMVIQFFIFTLLFMKGKGIIFIRDWLPYAALFLIFELLRGQADNLSPFYSKTLYAVYSIEASLFNKLPTLFLQGIFLDHSWIIKLSTFFYTSFFYYSFLAGFTIWVFKRELFHNYFTNFLLLSYVGVVIFFLIPTAPPWFIHIEGLDNVRRVIWDETIVSSLEAIRLFKYFEYSNHVAALPSLHTGWSAFTSFFLIKHFGRKMIISLIFPIMVAFSVILTGEHFLIDIILGGAIAYLSATGFFSRVLRIPEV